MASGKLGAANCAANSNTLLYTVPASLVATANLSLVNRTTAPIAIRVAIGTGSAPADQDYIEYGVSLPPGTPLERTALVLSAGEKVWVHAAAAGISARLFGYEETA